MTDENYLSEVDLEIEILATFLSDKKNICIANTILQDKYFIKEDYRKVFNYMKKRFIKLGILEFKDIIKDFQDNTNVQHLFANIYKYACYYVNPDLISFKENEHRLIEFWKKNQIDNFLKLYQNKEISYDFLKSKLEEVNNEQSFKKLLEMTRDIDNITQETPKERVYTKITDLDYLLKGLEYGYVYLWTGITNAGKTTLMAQLAKELLMTDHKIFYFSGEQTAKEFKNYLYVSMCNMTQIDYLKDPINEKIIDIIPKKTVQEYLNTLLKNKLYLYNNNISNHDIETMISVMEEAYRIGIRIYFIDNFMQLDDSELIEQQTRIMEHFKRFALKNNVIVNLVAHPRKIKDTVRLSVMDVSGTQNIANKASSIITISRIDSISDSKEYEFIAKRLLSFGYQINKCDSYLEVVKTKGNGNGVIGLVYDKNLKIYKQAEKMSVEERQKNAFVASAKRSRE